MTAIKNVNNIVIVSSVTIRDIKIFYNGKNHDTEIEIDIPMEEIILNAYEQLSSKFVLDKKH